MPQYFTAAVASMHSRVKPSRACVCMHGERDRDAWDGFTMDVQLETIWRRERERE